MVDTSSPQPETSLKAPFIVGEDFDPLDEQTLLQHGRDYDDRGPKAAAVLSAALLSMSGYEKTQESYLYDYATTRPAPEQSYPSFAQPSFASQYPSAQARQSHGPPSTEQMPFISGSQIEARDVAYQAPYPSYIDARSRHLPQVTSYSPSKVSATHGAKLYVYIQHTQDFASSPKYFSIMFGNKRCDATWQKLENRANPYFQYALSADIPPFETTQYLDGQMPLLLNVDDEYGQSLGVVEVGDFTYEDAVLYSPTQEIGRKRKVSADSMGSPPPKRVLSHSGQTLLAGRTRAPSTFSTTASSESPASAYLQNPSSGFAFPSGYERTQQTPSYGQHYQRAAQKPSYQYSPTLGGMVQTTVKRNSPSAAYGSNRSPAMMSRSQVMPSPSSMANPPLIRTSTLQPSAGGMGSSMAGGAQPFNPYSMYPNAKAVLKIEGELENMAVDWTKDEWEAKRRLVQFRRSQSGSTITTSFKAVSPEARTPHSICISCIWWAEKEECFVTSVDTIYLLESLVAVRFTVEEKNRIRRNLEGFRPLTVSKAKQESEEFFKVIMGFPTPKPRNIEKDVKVFPWKILSHALKKIIGKYSASYSSTAGALPAPHGYGADAGAGDLRHTASPRSGTSAAASTGYATGLTTTADGGLKSAGLGQSAGPPGLRVSVPQLGGGWPSHTQPAPSQYATGRASWDFAAAYMDASPGGGLGQRQDDAAVAGEQAYQQYGSGQRTSQS